MGRFFSEYGTPLMAVPLLEYLVRAFSLSDEYFPEVEKNLRRAQVKWRRIVKLLGREGEDRITAGRSYVVVMQAVLLFGSEMWVMTPRLENSFEGFHHRVVRQMAGMGPKLQQYGAWVYPPIGAALTTVGMDGIGVYIDR